MELRVLTDLTLLPRLIEFNYEELKEWLAGRLSDYDGRVVTEDGIKAAKADRAALNKLAKLIDDERKTIKAQCLKPYESFEEKTKELVAMIINVNAGIDSQIKAFDEARRQEKYKDIETHFNEQVGSLAGLVTLERVIHPKWANVSVTFNEIILHIDGKLNRIEREIKTIQSEGGKFVGQLTDYYLSTLDLGATLMEKARLIKQDGLLAARETKPPGPANIPPPAAEIYETHRQTQEEALQVIDFRVWVTQEQKLNLKAFLNSNNIKYGKVPVAV